MVMHAEIRIGDSIIMLSDEFPDMSTSKSPKTLGGSCAGIMLYVPDCDAMYKKAVDMGARSTMQPADMFWGDRMSQVVDPYGHVWSIATHKEDLTPEQVQERSAAFMKNRAEHKV